MSGWGQFPWGGGPWDGGPATIDELKDLASPGVPILLLDITSRLTGTVLRVSQLPVTYGGNTYSALIPLEGGVEGFEVRLEQSELGIAAIPEIAVTLANVDAAMSAWDNTNLFKGASITARLVLYDPTTELASTDALTVFKGICNPPDFENDARLRLTAFNRFQASLNLFPPIRVQQLSPTVFPPEGGKDSDSFSPTDTDSAIFRIIDSEATRSALGWPCGYGPIRGQSGYGGSNPVGNYAVAQVSNADIFSPTTIGKTGLGLTVDSLKDHIVVLTGGTGAGQSRRIASNTATTIMPASAWTTTPDATTDFAVLYGWCSRSKADCQARGMYEKDSALRTTRRFRGISYVPADYNFRSIFQIWAAGGRRSSMTDANGAKYNQIIPRVYGKGRISARILFTQTDLQVRGHMLVSEGEVSSLSDLIIEGKQIPKDQPSGSRADISGNWFARLGTRGGNTAHTRFPEADPYNLFAIVYLDTLPPQFISGSRFEASVLVTGRLVESVDKDGNSSGWAWTQSPGWIYLDVLKDSGWPRAEINLQKFHSYAQYADQQIATALGESGTSLRARFERNFVIADQRPLADVLSAIAGGARILAGYDADGKLEIECENRLADTTLTTAVAAPGVGFVRAADGAGISVGTELLIDEGGTNQETVTVLSVRLVSNLFEFEANFANIHSAGETVTAEPAYHFVDASLVLGPGNVREISRRSQPTADFPNELTGEFQNQFRSFVQDSVTLMDVREANELGARMTGQIPGDGFMTVDAAVRIARLTLFRAHGRRNANGTPASHGNLFAELESTVKSVLLRIGQIVAVTWPTKSWTAKQFRVVAISPAQDPLLPYWRIRYILREHDAQWYDDINNNAVAAPGFPTNIAPGGSGAGLGPVDTDLPTGDDPPWTLYLAT